MRSLWLEKLSINDFAINSDFQIILLLKDQTNHYQLLCTPADNIISLAHGISIAHAMSNAPGMSIAHATGLYHDFSGQ